MKNPHKHAALIKAWADGAEIEYKAMGDWYNIANPSWEEQCEYRVKAVPVTHTITKQYGLNLQGESIRDRSGFGFVSALFMRLQFTITDGECTDVTLIKG